MEYVDIKEEVNELKERIRDLERQTGKVNWKDVTEEIKLKPEFYGGVFYRVYIEHKGKSVGCFEIGCGYNCEPNMFDDRYDCIKTESKKTVAIRKAYKILYEDRPRRIKKEKVWR